MSLKHGAVSWHTRDRVGGLFVFCVALKSSVRCLCVCCYFSLLSLLYNITHLESFAKIYFSSSFLFFFFSFPNLERKGEGKDDTAMISRSTPLTVRWLRLGTAIAGVAGLLPGQGPKILRACGCDRKKKIHR